MSLPRLRARLRDSREIANVLRNALMHKEQIVPLVELPQTNGQHLLEIDVVSEGIVTLLADPLGDATAEGQPMLVRPITRPQMATLLALVEQLDVPAAIQPTEQPPRPESLAPMSDRTVVHAMVFSASDLPPGSGPISSAPISILPSSLPVSPRPVSSSQPLSSRPSIRPLVRPSSLPPGRPLSLVPAPLEGPVSFGSMSMAPDSVQPASVGPVSLGPDSFEPASYDGPASHAPASQAIAPPRLREAARGPASKAAPGATAERGPKSDKVDPLIGRMIAGKFRIESLIGSGSTAAVYRATHVHLKRAVAIKILHPQNANESQFVQRFKGEARAASRLEHANVARVIDFGQEKDGLLYLVMELLEGRSLEAILAASGSLPQESAIDITMQVATALAIAHEIGIIHRDVKPENLVLVASKDDDGNAYDLVKVCDFGIAKLRDPDPEAEDLTTAGMLCGSPAYMSPEQARGEPLDIRTDIYSLGVTLYECLTGVMPHEANSLVELFTKKMIEPARPIRPFVPDVDAGLEQLVMRAVAIDREARQPSARALKDELRKVLARIS